VEIAGLGWPGGRGFCDVTEEPQQFRSRDMKAGKPPPEQDDLFRARLVEVIALVTRLLAQKPKDKKKLCSLHEPAVDCISRGKAHKRYEFGTKLSVATTSRGGVVVGIRALPGNPYDGHALDDVLEQAQILTDQKPEFAFADRGYRGHGVENVKVFVSGAKRGVTKTIAKPLRRHSAIASMIGHMKNDGRLTRCPFLGTEDDAIFAVLCGCGHNIRMAIRRLRDIFCLVGSLIKLTCMILDVQQRATEKRSGRKTCRMMVMPVFVTAR